MEIDRLARVNLTREGEIARAYSTLKANDHIIDLGGATQTDPKMIPLSRTIFPEGGVLVAEESHLTRLRLNFGRRNGWYFLSPKATIQINSDKLQPFTTQQAVQIADLLSERQTSVTDQLTTPADYKEHQRRFQFRSKRLAEIRELYIDDHPNSKIIITSAENALAVLEPEYPRGHRRLLLYCEMDGVTLEVGLNWLTPDPKKIVEPSVRPPELVDFGGKRKIPTVLMRLIPTGFPPGLSPAEAEEVSQTHFLGEPFKTPKKGDKGPVVQRTLVAFAEQYERVLDAIVRALDPSLSTTLPEVVVGAASKAESH